MLLSLILLWNELNLSCLPLWTSFWYPLRRLSTRLLEVFPKDACNFSKSCSNVAQKQSKVAFCIENCSKVARKNKFKTFFGFDAKICKLNSKCKISNHFCAIFRRSQRSEITLSSIKPTNAMSQYIWWMTLFTRDNQVSRVWIFVQYYRWPCSPAGFILYIYLILSAPGGGGEDLAPFLQEIHKLSTKIFRNMGEKPI